ncbi:MAG: cyclase family protein, partial [Candidatus Hydrogenedentales bacterium]
DDVIGPDELEAVAAAQALQFESGDALLIRTGWMRTWSGDQRTFHAQQPGIDLAAAEWAGENEIALLGADNSAVECFPVKDDFLPVHREFLRNQGGYLLELLDIEQLAADGVHEFLFALAPLNIKLGLGSPVTPLAIA